MASGATFLNEVYEQFLTCKVCSKTFKDPKALNCLHTFCCECLEKCYESEEQERRPYRFLLYARAISCPVCSAKTDIPAGGISRLPDNSFLDGLSRMVSRSAAQSSSDKLCEICTVGKTTTTTSGSGERPAAASVASTKCMDCSKFLCQECTIRHRSTKVTQMHSLFKLDIEKDIQCKTHAGEMIKYFCRTCDECVCLLCAFQAHKSHDVGQVAEVVETGKLSLRSTIDECRELMAKMTARIDAINAFQTFVKESEDGIRECATEMVTLIRQRERDLLSSLKQSTDSECIGNSTDKEKLESNLHKLEVVSRQANSMVDENNVEVILAKKLLREQMAVAMENVDLSSHSVPAMEPSEANLRFQRLLGKLRDDHHHHHHHVLCDRSIQTEVEEEKSPPAPSEPTSEDHPESPGEIFVPKGPQWQRPALVVAVVQNPLVLPSIVLKHVRAEAIRKKKDAWTEMPRVSFADKSSATNRLLLCDKETATTQAKVMHKNVSTVSQLTADKSTSTSGDAASVHRTVANAKRQITVSRGTMTTFHHPPGKVAGTEASAGNTSPDKIYNGGQGTVVPTLTFVSHIDVSSTSIV